MLYSRHNPTSPPLSSYLNVQDPFLQGPLVWQINAVERKTSAMDMLGAVSYAHEDITRELGEAFLQKHAGRYFLCSPIKRKRPSCQSRTAFQSYLTSSNLEDIDTHALLREVLLKQPNKMLKIAPILFAQWIFESESFLGR